MSSATDISTETTYIKKIPIENNLRPEVIKKIFYLPWREQEFKKNLTWTWTWSLGFSEKTKWFLGQDFLSETTLANELETLQRMEQYTLIFKNYKINLI